MRESLELHFKKDQFSLNVQFIHTQNCLNETVMLLFYFFKLSYILEAVKKSKL